MTKDTSIKSLPGTSIEGLASTKNMSRESWKILQVQSELVEGYQKIAEIHPSVSIFGSARTDPEHPYYKATEDIAYRLSEAGFAVVSGGGPGIMEAANKGAYAGPSKSVGLN